MPRNEIDPVAEVISNPYMAASAYRSLERDWSSNMSKMLMLLEIEFPIWAPETIKSANLEFYYQIVKASANARGMRTIREFHNLNIGRNNSRQVGDLEWGAKSKSPESGFPIYVSGSEVSITKDGQETVLLEESLVPALRFGTSMQTPEHNKTYVLSKKDSRGNL